MTNPPDPKTKTPRTEVAKVGAEWIIASHSAGDFVRADVAETLELENQSLTRRLEEAEKGDKDMSETLAELNQENSELDQQLTALRTAAEGALSGFAQALRQWKAYHDGTFEQAVDDADLEDANHLEGEFYQSATAALAALRAELDQPASNASNSPTASRESQG